MQKKRIHNIFIISLIVFEVFFAQNIFASNIDKQCWFVNPDKIKPSDIDIVVRTINTHHNAPDYPARLLGIAQRLKNDWPYTVGIIGMQEVKGKIDNCPASPGVYNGAECFALILSKVFDVEVDSAYSVPDHVGIVAGAPWKIIESNYWNVGTIFERRYLLETILVHKYKGWKLRFYTVHLSSQKRHRFDRLRQIKKVINIVTERANPGELPPIVAGDFNARRIFDGTMPEPSVLEMEKYFWRPVDKAIVCGKHETGRDIIYIGKKSVFKNSIGDYVLIRTNDINFCGITEKVEGFPEFFNELTDHNSQGFSFHIVTRLNDNSR